MALLGAVFVQLCVSDGGLEQALKPPVSFSSTGVILIHLMS